MACLTSTSALAGWQVQWIDTFEGNSVNWDNWTAQTNANYNNEVQCYTDDDSSIDQNYQISQGILKIIARKQDNNCVGLGGRQMSWTSGRLNSKDKAEFLYGRIEARIKFNNLEGGTWPAFWMLENRINQQPIKNDDDFSGWPTPGAGEIDVWEWFSNQPSTYITNFFNTNSCGSEVRYNYPNGGNDVLNWHRYALEWDENSMRFYIDETLVTQHDISSCAQYKEPMFILLNVAMGGSLGGSIDPSLTNATMEVDYVAHCQKDDSNSMVFCDESTPTNSDTVLADIDKDGISDNNDLCPDSASNSIVDSNGCVIPEEPNQAPVALAGPDPTIIYSGEYVSLDAGQSSDADGDLLQYFWQQTGGVNVELINHTSSSVTFIAPDVTEKNTLNFTVEVSDGSLSDTAEVFQDIYPPEETTTEVIATETEPDNSSGGSLYFILTATFILLFRKRLHE